MLDFIFFTIGCACIYVGVKEEKKSKQDDDFFLVDLEDRPVILNVVDTTMEATFTKLEI